MELQFNAPLFVAVISAGLILLARVKYGKYLAVFVFSIFLIIALPTAINGDFDAYKGAFESLALTMNYPYVEYSSNLTAEIGFIWYMLPFHFITEDFNYFLALNFLFLASVGAFLLKKISLDNQDIRSIALFALPALIPLIFYWSPRSGPSLVLILGMFYFLNSNKTLLAFLLAFLASIIHSQYIPIISVMLFTFLMPFKKKMLIGFLTSLAVLITLKYGVSLIKLLPFGDVYKVAIMKLHYIEDLGASGGVRPAGIGIIILCLTYIIFLRKKLSIKIGNNPAFAVKNLLDICVSFSLIANLLFIQDSHVAGRIARFSDFFIIVVGIGFITKHLFHKKYLMPVTVLSFFLLLVFYKNIYFMEVS